METPPLHHQIAEKIFKNRTLTKEQLEEILSCEKTTLTKDLHTIIQLCSNDLDNIDDDISDYTLCYALFLLKENESQNQLNIILDILKWSDDEVDYWFGDCFCQYLWCLIYHFGQHQTDTLFDFLKQDGIETFSREQVALALYQIYLKNPDKQNSISTQWTELLEFYNTIPESSERIDHTYFAFFVMYICQPNSYQKELIKNLYTKGYVDLYVNGDYDNLFKKTEPERKCLTVFDVCEDLLKTENSPIANFYPQLFEGFDENRTKQIPIISEKKTGRNDPCPCGSGKKYKKCCVN